ncbi:MAG: CBS domain-containing protein [Nostocales cyanobacterium 94392]|nr:CBS domain-containing protein [Nostocales cyanobacterium 94392]
MLPVGMGITVHLGDNMMQVVEKMREARSQRLLVTNNGNLEGIISATDLANTLQRQREFGEDIPRPNTFSEQARNNFRQETKV